MHPHAYFPSLTEVEEQQSSVMISKMTGLQKKMKTIDRSALISSRYVQPSQILYKIHLLGSPTLAPLQLLTT